MSTVDRVSNLVAFLLTRSTDEMMQLGRLERAAPEVPPPVSRGRQPQIGAGHLRFVHEQQKAV